MTLVISACFAFLFGQIGTTWVVVLRIIDQQSLTLQVVLNLARQLLLLLDRLFHTDGVHHQLKLLDEVGWK